MVALFLPPSRVLTHLDTQSTTFAGCLLCIRYHFRSGSKISKSRGTKVLSSVDVRSWRYAPDARRESGGITDQRTPSVTGQAGLI